MGIKIHAGGYLTADTLSRGWLCIVYEVFYGSPRTSNVKNLALTRVKFHVPFYFPSL